MIVTVCMSPSIDISVEVDSLNIGETNVVKNKKISFGGKALNVAVGIKRLGGDCHATGFMYNENGYAFENALNKEGVPFTFVWNKGRVRENYKFIDSRSMLTEVNDVGQPVGLKKADELLGMVRMYSAKSAVTVLSGGLPKGIEPAFYASLVRAVDEKSLKVVDATGAKLFAALGEGVDLVKPNLEELQNTLGKYMQTKDDLLAGCYELLDRGAKRVLLSLGKQGAIITDGSKSYYCKSINVAVNSTVGAGDAMVAAASLMLEQDAPIQEILRSGVAAGTATVMTKDSVSLTKEKYQEVFATLEVQQL